MYKVNPSLFPCFLVILSLFPSFPVSPRLFPWFVSLFSNVHLTEFLEVAKKGVMK